MKEREKKRERERERQEKRKKRERIKERKEREKRRKDWGKGGAGAGRVVGNRAGREGAEPPHPTAALRRGHHPFLCLLSTRLNVLYEKKSTHVKQPTPNK